MQFETANGVLIARNGGEMLRIEPWGKNSLRVRATMLPELSNQDWALTETPESSHVEVECHEVDHWVGDGTIDKRESASVAPPGMGTSLPITNTGRIASGFSAFSSS